MSANSSNYISYNQKSLRLLCQNSNSNEYINQFNQWERFSMEFVKLNYFHRVLRIENKQKIVNQFVIKISFNSIKCLKLVIQTKYLLNFSSSKRLVSKCLHVKYSQSRRISEWKLSNHKRIEYHLDFKIGVNKPPSWLDTTLVRH